MDSVIVDAGKYVGEPGLRIDVVELCRHDQRRHEGGAVGTTFGAGEEPGLAAEGKAAQRALRRIVCQADPSVIDEASEPIPAAQHVIDRLGDRGRVRQPGALLAQPCFQCRQKRGALFFTHPQPLFGALAVDAALNIEQCIDALDRLQRDWRDCRGVLVSPRIGGDVRQFKKLPPGMGPTECGRDRSLCARGVIQLVIAAIGVGLQDTGEVLEMPRGMLPPSIARGVIERGRRRPSAIRPVVADIMRWTVPALISCERAPQEGGQAMVTIGLDISKSWFQIHWITADGEIIRKKLARGKVLDFFSRLPSCLVGLEACGSAHHWARELIKLGHKARLMPARYVRAYVKTNKHDAADAEACWEAVQRPGMRFVPVKTVEQQGILMLHRTRDLLIRQRTGAINALRGHLGELGIVTGKGKANARELMALVDVDERIPQSARSALSILVDQIEDLELHIESHEKMILATAKDNEVCRRLMKVAGIGPFAATALAASVDHPQQFASARHFAAWLGLVPKQHSTGGRERLGGISKRGDGYIRKLLIHGARAAVHRVRIHQVTNTWITELLGRRPFNVVTVALAHKTARIAWAIMANGEEYRAQV